MPRPWYSGEYPGERPAHYTGRDLICSTLALALLVLGIFATDHHHDAPPPDDLAAIAARLHRCLNLHANPPPTTATQAVQPVSHKNTYISRYAACHARSEICDDAPLYLDACATRAVSHASTSPLSRQLGHPRSEGNRAQCDQHLRIASRDCSPPIQVSPRYA
jgi:hypothetical protein